MLDCCVVCEVKGVNEGVREELALEAVKDDTSNDVEEAKLLLEGGPAVEVAMLVLGVGLDEVLTDELE